MNLSEKEILTILRICLESNLITTAQIEHWATTIVMSSKPVRHDYILELCSSKRIGINETVHILKTNEDAPQNELIWHVVYGISGLLFAKKTISLKTACSFASKVAQERFNIDKSDVFDTDMDDAYYLADKGGHIDLEDLENKFTSATQDYIPVAKQIFERQMGLL